MPEYRVTFTRTLIINGSFLVKAKDDEKAMEKAEEIAGSDKIGHVNWTMEKTAEPFKSYDIDDEEDDVTINEVNEE